MDFLVFISKKLGARKRLEGHFDKLGMVRALHRSLTWARAPKNGLVAPLAVTFPFSVCRLDESLILVTMNNANNWVTLIMTK